MVTGRPRRLRRVGRGDRPIWLSMAFQRNGHRRGDRHPVRYSSGPGLERRPIFPPGDQSVRQHETSNSVALTVQALVPLVPMITGQPQAATITAGSGFTLAVCTASSTSPLSYQWYRNGTAIAGATGSIYAVTSATGADAGSYAVMVSNSFGSVTSASATIAVNISRLLASARRPAAVAEEEPPVGGFTGLWRSPRPGSARASRPVMAEVLARCPECEGEFGAPHVGLGVTLLSPGASNLDPCP